MCKAQRCIIHTYWKKYIKACVETITEKNPSLTRSCVKAIIARTCSRTLEYTSEHLASVSFMPQSQDNLPRLYHRCSHLYPSLRGGIDILRPLILARGKIKFVIVAVDYFTKWVEVEPLAKITEENCLQFVKEHVVFRFGVPKAIVSDNGLQFGGKDVSQLLVLSLNEKLNNLIRTSSGT